MLLHLRMIAPSERTGELVAMLRADPAVTHLMVLPGAAVEPAGDVVLCDVAREAASRLLQRLRRDDLPRLGSIDVEPVELSMSAAGVRAEDAAPGLGVDAVVWEEIEHRTGEETELSATFLALLTVATIIAAIGVLLDQPILIIGAMVVGPEFGPLAALCVSLVQQRWRTMRRSAVALGVGFPFAMLLTAVVTGLLTAMGVVDRSMLTADRPLTDFIWRPDALSWIVAFLAGIAGMLSLTSAKSGALIGVLISVTTVPAAANGSVALAYGVWREAGGSLVQLLVNIVAILTGGLLTLLVQRTVWRRRGRGWERAGGRPPAAA